MELYKPSVVQKLLDDYNLRAKKGFGQNFLVDRNVLEKIGAAADFQVKDNVLEIGPGLGTLGAFFAPAVKRWLAVEIDRDLAPVLEIISGQAPNFQVVFGDFLQMDLAELMGDTEYKVVANLPYYITTPILLKILESATKWDKLILMVQWEVAKRYTAGPGGKDYGSISLFLQYWSDVSIVTKVSKNCFLPTPEVDSAVIALTRHRIPPVEVDDEALLFKVIRSAFHQRRKTIANSLAAAPFLTYNPAQIQEALAQAGIDPRKRAETLNLAGFAQLTNAFGQL